MKRSDGKIGQGMQNGKVKFDRLWEEELVPIKVYTVRLGRSHRISVRDGVACSSSHR